MMTKSDKKFYFSFIFLMSLAVVIGLVVGLKVVRPRIGKVELPENPKTDQVEMRVGEAELLVEVRDDDKERELGLSGREVLGENEGMYFKFDVVARPVFWMKDMLIDLDVVWIREGEVIGVQEEVPAPTEADPVVKTMTPPEEVDSVLEVPAGWVQKNEVKVGDVVTFTSG